MSVFKVKNSPYYQFDFQIRGHRFFGSTGCRNEREAKEVEKAKRAEAVRLVNESIAAKREPMTVETACDRWWDEVGQHGKDPDLKRALKWLKAELGPKTFLHDINDNMITLATQARRKHVMRGGKDAAGKQLYRPLSNRTVNKTVPSLLRRVMNRAKASWSVVIFVEPNWENAFLDEHQRPVREISHDEDARLNEVESVDFAELREFAEITGLRRKELLLTWPQVDFQERVLRIIGKGDVPAIVPLTHRAYEILWNRRHHDAWHVWTFVAERTRKCPKTGKQFVRGDRFPMTYYGIGTNRRRKWPKAGVNARLHDTRHTTGQRTLRATGNLKLVQTLLRHTEISTTAKFYTDTNMTDLRAGMERTESQKKSQTDNQTSSNLKEDKA